MVPKAARCRRRNRGQRKLLIRCDMAPIANRCAANIRVAGGLFMACGPNHHHHGAIFPSAIAEGK